MSRFKKDGSIDRRSESNRKILRHLTHGLSDHPLHGIWSDMKKRCYCITNSQYYNYGARGVRVCKEWISDFKSFYDWAIKNGWKKGKEIDKDILGDGKLYSPSTCCIVDRKTNGRNKRNSVMIVYNGKEQCLSAWCEELHLDYSLMRGRLVKRGWPVEKAFTTPVIEEKRNNKQKIK